VLTFDTVEALTYYLHLFDQPPPTSCTEVAMLLLEHVDPATGREQTWVIELRRPHPDQPLPEHLHHLAQWLPGRLAAMLRPTAIGATTVIACAVRYTDIELRDGSPRLVHRVEAVDVDRRVYQLVRDSTDTTPAQHIDEQPDPAQSTATHAGLVAVLTAAQTVSSRAAEQRRPSARPQRARTRRTRAIRGKKNRPSDEHPSARPRRPGHHRPRRRPTLRPHGPVPRHPPEHGAHRDRTGRRWCRPMPIAPARLRPKRAPASVGHCTPVELEPGMRFRRRPGAGN
jgi:hypothetical protein